MYRDVFFALLCPSLGSKTIILFQNTIAHTLCVQILLSLRTRKVSEMMTISLLHMAHISSYFPLQEEPLPEKALRTCRLRVERDLGAGLDASSDLTDPDRSWQLHLVEVFEKRRVFASAHLLGSEKISCHHSGGMFSGPFGFVLKW